MLYPRRVNGVDPAHQIGSSRRLVHTFVTDVLSRVREKYQVHDADPGVMVKRVWQVDIIEKKWNVDALDRRQPPINLCFVS